MLANIDRHLSQNGQFRSFCHSLVRLGSSWPLFDPSWPTSGDGGRISAPRATFRRLWGIAERARITGGNFSGRATCWQVSDSFILCAIPVVSRDAAILIVRLWRAAEGDGGRRWRSLRARSSFGMLARARERRAADAGRERRQARCGTRHGCGSPHGTRRTAQRPPCREPSLGGVGAPGATPGTRWLHLALRGCASAGGGSVAVGRRSVWRAVVRAGGWSDGREVAPVVWRLVWAVWRFGRRVVGRWSGGHAIGRVVGGSVVRSGGRSLGTAG